MQLHFNFEGKSETEFLLDELARTNHQLNNLRRGLFGRYTKLEKRIEQLEKLQVKEEETKKIVDLPLLDYLESLEA